MNTDKLIITLNKKTTLSTLWIFVLLNVIFRDLHDLLRPGLLEQMMTGVVNGNPMTEEFLLIAGIGLELIIMMVILSQVLTYRWNRWLNIIIATIGIPTLYINGLHDLDDIWFMSIAKMGLLAIIWTAWTWRKPQQEIVAGIA